MLIKVTQNKKQRLDKFLFEKNQSIFSFSLSRSEWTKIILKGWILVNNKKVKPHYIVSSSDKITLQKEKISRWIKEKTSVLPNSKIKLNIVFQDKNILIINKPARLQIHPDKHERSNTLANALLAHFPNLKNVGDDPERPGIVHRLDKETSGLLIVAKQPQIFQELKTLFQKHQIEKTYQAVVYGKMKNKKGIVNLPLARSFNYKKQTIATKKTKTRIRSALTYYKVLKTTSNFSWLELKPFTGRTHQIRVHLHYLGHPLVGDKLYKLKTFKTFPTTSRHLLHASSLKFQLFNKKYFFQVPPPQDIRIFLEKYLRNN